MPDNVKETALKELNRYEKFRPAQLKALSSAIISNGLFLSHGTMQQKTGWI